MSTSSACLTISGILVEVLFKPIKNLHLAVYPPEGRVRVAAPDRLTEEQVRLAIIERLPWIRRHQRRLQEATRQSSRELVSGESHYVWGQRLRLTVAERPGRASVSVDGGRLCLGVPAGTERHGREKALQEWYRAELHAKAGALVEQWAPQVGRPVPYWNVRKMKTLWGSCNPQAGRVWFNMELAKKPTRSLEYIVVHELAHLIERRHDERFQALMDQLLPDWRSRRDELNQQPLGHEEWAG